MATGDKSAFRQATKIACLFCACIATACTLLFAPIPARAQSRSITPATPDYSSGLAPNQEKGRALLDTIRNSTLDGDFYFEFQLRLRPRRGADTRIPGRMWGTRNAKGPITRITLNPGSPTDERQLLIQNGPESVIWSASPANTAIDVGESAPAGKLTPEAMFEPLAGVDLTAFELQMPFIYWKDYTYEGLRAGNNRPTHAFLMRPPADIAAVQPGLTGVRLYYDEGWSAITVFEILGPNGATVKTMRLKESQKAGSQMFLRKAELRNERTGNGTDFEVLMAGLQLTLPREIFDPANLSTPATPPPPNTLWKARE